MDQLYQVSAVDRKEMAPLPRSRDKHAPVPVFVSAAWQCTASNTLAIRSSGDGSAHCCHKNSLVNHLVVSITNWPLKCSTETTRPALPPQWQSSYSIQYMNHTWPVQKNPSFVTGKVHRAPPSSFQCGDPKAHSTRQTLAVPWSRWSLG